MTNYGFIPEGDHGLKRLFKRFIRRMLRWLLLPIFEEFSVYKEKQEEQQEVTLRHRDELEAHQNALQGHRDELAAHRNTIHEFESELEAHQYALQGHGDELAAHRNSIRGLVDVLESHNNIINNSSYLQYIQRKTNEAESNNKTEVESTRNIFSDNQLQAKRIIADSETIIEPAYFTSDVTALFVASDTYACYLGALLQSIIDNSNIERTYDLLVFETDISVHNMNLLSELVKEHTNISIRFIDVNAVLNIGKLSSINSDYSYFNYIRLIAPELLMNYQKVLYLDSDVIVNTDLAELYDCDVSGYCLAGTIDIYINGLLNYENELQKYLNSIGITLPGTYLQSGVLIINITEIHKVFEPYYFINKAYNEKYIWADQDILNVYCKGRIKYLDLRWNVFALHKDLAKSLEINLTDELYEEYTRARSNPKIIHYVDKQLPNNYPTGDFGEIYWKYARKTPFYEWIIYS